MATYDPFRDLDRLAAGFFDTRRVPRRMPMDLYRDGDHYVLSADLPGIDPGSVDIDVDNDGVYETNLAASAYVTLPLNGVGSNRQTGWPTTELRIVDRVSYFPHYPRPSVKVSATFGWAAVPVDVVEATYLFTARLYAEVAVPLGITSANVDFGLPGSPIQPPYEVQRLLNPYRRAETVIGVA